MALPDDIFDSEDITILPRVTLESFTKSPETIVPFGACLLTWEVQGPEEGYHLELNRRRVPLSGSLVVQPQRTTRYTLSAKASFSRKILGSLTVSVNLASCKEVEVFDFGSNIVAGLNSEIQKDPELYFRLIPSGFDLEGNPNTPKRSVPIVTITPGTIEFRLALAARVENFVNPSVDIEARFGLQVVDGVLVPTRKEIKVDVSVPWWAWGIPGAMIPLALAISNGEVRARQKTDRAIQVFTDLLNLLTGNIGAALGPGDGKKAHSVRIEVEESGEGILIVTECPDELLRATAHASAGAVIQ